MKLFIVDLLSWYNNVLCHKAEIRADKIIANNFENAN